jgi:aspartyl-tRNA(Asn)/glutamyl-tRNA(Gln) amidotransferase subunit B
MIMEKLIPVIGLEIHTELKTKSKMFCRCDNNSAGQAANTLVCPICLGHPGTLPQPNQQAVHFCLLLAKALNCQVNQHSRFARKNYFYPDLPKGYQITQADTPLGYNGKLDIDGREIFITRIHLEEDTGKLTHDKGNKYSLVDYNRAGTPLIELVTGPVLTSGVETRRFGQEFQKLLRYLGISGANMEKAEMRCEANISLQEAGHYEIDGSNIYAKEGYKLNHKVEVKNLNSFKALERAIDCEIKRQGEVLASGGTIAAETRGWDEATNATKTQRVKETMADYRYFEEPDIPPLGISDKWLKETAEEVTKIELPIAKAKRWQTDYQITMETADLLTSWPELAVYTDKVLELAQAARPKQAREIVKVAINWLTSELLKHCRLDGFATCPISPQQLVDLALAIVDQQINSTAGQAVLVKLVKNNNSSVAEVIEKLDLGQVDNSDELVELAKAIIVEYPQQVSAYRSGKTPLLQFFVGQLMRRSQGKANPQVAQEVLEKELNQ